MTRLAISQSQRSNLLSHRVKIDINFYVSYPFMSLTNALSSSSHHFDFNMSQLLFSWYLVSEGKSRLKSCPIHTN